MFVHRRLLQQLAGLSKSKFFQTVITSQLERVYCKPRKVLGGSFMGEGFVNGEGDFKKYCQV